MHWQNVHKWSNRKMEHLQKEERFAALIYFC